MENFLSALSAFASRTKLSDIALGVIFLLVGYLCMPEPWGEWLASKTPAAFPWGLTLNDLTVFAFSLVCILIYRRGRVFLSSKPWGNRKLTSKKIERICNENLNEFDIAGLCIICSGKFQRSTLDDMRIQVSVNKLLGLKLIKPSMYGYTAPQPVKDFVFQRISQDPDFQKSLYTRGHYNPHP